MRINKILVFHMPNKPVENKFLDGKWKYYNTNTFELSH